MRPSFGLILRVITLTGWIALAGLPSSIPRADENKMYCVAELPTPVLNTPRISSIFGGEDGKSVKVDSKGLIREMEFIAFPGTVFEVETRLGGNGHDILKVTTDDYPYRDTALYIDSRFVRYSVSRPANREKALPPAEDILKALYSMEGRPYMWGGNVHEGIREMTEFYEPSGSIDRRTEKLWRLEGVDCSGLIYQASNGYTPRNTSSLTTFGRGMDISGLNADGIALAARPLDLIVWPGHVLIVLDKGYVIESSGSSGVTISDLTTRLKRLMAERKAADDPRVMDAKSFVLRRWYGRDH